jgi:hypothetical protein
LQQHSGQQTAASTTSFQRQMLWLKRMKLYLLRPLNSQPLCAD